MTTKLDGSTVVVDIESIDDDGLGKGNVRDREMHVRGAFPGESARIHIEHVSPHSGTAYGHATEILQASPHRRQSPCEHAQCGACPLIELEESAQTQAKQQLVENALAKVLSTGTQVNDVVTVPPFLGYRRRAKYVLARRRGWLRFGAYAQRSHAFVDTQLCPIVAPSISSILAPVQELLTQYSVDIDGTNRPGLRYLQVRSNTVGELLLTFVARELPVGLRQCAQEIMQTQPDVVGITVDENTSDGDVILSGRGQTLVGVETLKQRISGVDVEIDPYAFVQHHGPAGDHLADNVADLVAKRAKGPVLDLYAGVGALAFAIARQGLSVDAVERDSHATSTGAQAAQTAGLDIHYITATSEDYLQHMTKTYACIVVDPPRRGLSPRARQVLVQTDASHIVYVSCSLHSLHRDLQEFIKAGWKTSVCTPIDLFPQTAAIEVIVVLERQ